MSKTMTQMDCHGGSYLTYLDQLGTIPTVYKALHHSIYEIMMGVRFDLDHGLNVSMFLIVKLLCILGGWLHL